MSTRTPSTSCNNEVDDTNQTTGNESTSSRKRQKVSFLIEDKDSSSSSPSKVGKDESLKDIYLRRHEIFAFFADTPKRTVVNEKEKETTMSSQVTGILKKSCVCFLACHVPTWQASDLC